ncbi:MAG: PIN domain-containing protein [Solirubrobacteraceae bacterium]
MQLADTSAWVWTHAVGGQVREDFDATVVEGQIATCAMVRLELLYSTRNAGEFARLRADLAALVDLPIAQPQWDRAVQVYDSLAQQGGMHHRSVKHPDLLIAAAAEAAEVEILHYDEDYDRIAAITGQPVRWLAPRGSLR